MGKVAIAVVVAAVVMVACGDDDETSDPASVIEQYQNGYNTGDIEAVMVLFRDDSTITDHPFVEETVGLDAIRTLQAADLSAAAESDAYEFSNVEVDGDTVTWDHVWTNDIGDQYCARGHSAVIADGTIKTWSFSTDADLCE